MEIPQIKIVRARRMSISIEITKQGEVIVKAPVLAPKFLIDRFINEKKDWIEKSLAKVSTHVPKKRLYQEGEEFLFLGNFYSLHFYTGIEIIAKDHTLYFPKALEFRIKKELENWYRKKAQEIIFERVAHWAEVMKATYKDIFLSDTSSKWGTCFADNTLQFNYRLIMAPLMVLDYVIIHELTHTTEKHHQDSFWRRVRLFTPAYKQHRKWLDQHEGLLHF